MNSESTPKQTFAHIDVSQNLFSLEPISYCERVDLTDRSCRGLGYRLKSHQRLMILLLAPDLFSMTRLEADDGRKGQRQGESANQGG